MVDNSLYKFKKKIEKKQQESRQCWWVSVEIMDESML